MCWSRDARRDCAKDGSPRPDLGSQAGCGLALPNRSVNCGMRFRGPGNLESGCHKSGWVGGCGRGLDANHMGVVPRTRLAAGTLLDNIR